MSRPIQKEPVLLFFGQLQLALQLILHVMIT
jgi:hypothetical protein